MRQGLLVALVPVLLAAVAAAGEAASPVEPQAGDAAKRRELPVQIEDTWHRLAKDYEVWLDLNKKQVLVGGNVTLRRGALEMFACPQRTKEHESVVAVNSPARFVHAGLLALGLEPGTPVKFNPEYAPATGTTVDVDVIWRDEKGKQRRVDAQQWVQDTKTGKAMKHSWVFVGSGFWEDPSTGERFYSADAGDFICVSNFPTAMLDLPIESTQANNQLLFVAFTENIPPRGTRVLLVLKPELPEKKQKTATKPQPVPDKAKKEKTEKK